MSYQKIAQKTQISSHNTVQEYISVLESSFALKVLYAMDLNTSGYKFKKEKKFYFTDPLLYWLSSHLANQTNKSPQNQHPLIAEHVAHEFLSRKYDRFGYFSNQNGEIDFVLPKKWAIEIKWTPYAHNLSQSYLKTFFPFKSVWTQSNYLEELP